MNRLLIAALLLAASPAMAQMGQPGRGGEPMSQREMDARFVDHEAQYWTVLAACLRGDAGGPQCLGYCHAGATQPLLQPYCSPDGFWRDQHKD